MTPEDLKDLTVAHVKQAYLDGVNAGIAAEREACARMCEMHGDGVTNDFYAKMIRDRSKR